MYETNESAQRNDSIPANYIKYLDNFTTIVLMLECCKILSNFRTFNDRRNVFNNNTKFVESGRHEPLRQLNIIVDVPKSFHDILGPGQARVEIDGLKRDISSLANFRIQDAIKRKIAGNQDLVHENSSLKMAVSNLQQIVVNNNRQAEALQVENSRLRMMLEMANNNCIRNNNQL